jgi:hypothetical protein
MNSAPSWLLERHVPEKPTAIVYITGWLLSWIKKKFDCFCFSKAKAGNKASREMKNEPGRSTGRIFRWTKNQLPRKLVDHSKIDMTAAIEKTMANEQSQEILTG